MHDLADATKVALCIEGTVVLAVLALAVALIERLASTDTHVAAHRLPNVPHARPIVRHNSHLKQTDKTILTVTPV